MGRTGMVTGKTTRSVCDYVEKIETSFLEKYVIYLLRDNIGQKLLIDNDPNANTFKNLFTTVASFERKDLADRFK